ncbi:MAG TPA: glycosyltransferase family 9 protein [Planctomycetota bacterium]|nr:glycosyltransferase family 9 protein [Planctomycetota bacterium]
MIATGPRILFIRLSAVGDVINTLPALEALRRGLPDAFIGYVVEDRAHDLITHHPSVDRVHLYKRKRWARYTHQPIHWWDAIQEFSLYVGAIRRERYTIALDFQGNLKGAMHALLSGARRRVGFSRGHCKEQNYFFNNEHVTPPGGTEKINRVEKFLSLVGHLGVPVGSAGYRLPETRDGRARVDAFLSKGNLTDYAVIHPGTSDFGALKRWRTERFAELAERIGRATPLRPVISWGPGERPLAEQIVAGSKGQAVLAMETANILDLAELIRSARLYVGCDSGPLHLSSAVSTPSVALFGPKDPRTYGPYNPHHRVVLKGELGQGSMEAISVDDAFSAVQDLLVELSQKQPGSF